MKLYSTAGTLAHEKQNVYTDVRISELSEQIEVRLPDGWKEVENVYGETLIEDPNGKTYTVASIVRTWADKPVLTWYEDGHERRIQLEEV